MKQLKRLRAKKKRSAVIPKKGNAEWLALCAQGTPEQNAWQWSGPMPPMPRLEMRPEDALRRGRGSPEPATFTQGQAIVMGWRKEAKDRYHQSAAYRLDQKRKQAKRKAEKEQKCA